MLLGKAIALTLCSNSTTSPVMQILSNNTAYSSNSGAGRFVHEHLVRDRSEALADQIELEKSEMRTQGTVTIHIRAGSLTVERWTNWLYGQPMVCTEDDPSDYADEVLIRVVEVYTLAHKYDDYGCANACSDAVREMLVEQRASLQDPITLLLPMFESDCYKTHKMLIHSLAYGPCVDSGELRGWLEYFDAARRNSPDGWAAVYRELCEALAARCAAQTSQDLEDVPDFMEAHAYHLLKPGESLCCGRGMDD